MGYLASRISKELSKGGLIQVTEKVVFLELVRI